MKNHVERPGFAAALDEAMSGVEDEFVKGSSPEYAQYWYYHRDRYAFVVRLLERYRRWRQEQGQPIQRLLDVGPMYQTLLFRRLFDDIQIETMGLESCDIQFDLNDAYYSDRWPVRAGGPYDMIVMLEVLEHLYTAPTQVLRCIKTLVRPGGLLVVQTPNAVSLKARLRMACGRHPFELIRESRENPGHFREYTRAELTQLAAVAGFRTVEVAMSSRFLLGGSYRLDHLSDWFSRYLPQDFRNSATMVFESCD